MFSHLLQVSLQTMDVADQSHLDKLDLEVSLGSICPSALNLFDSRRQPSTQWRCQVTRTFNQWRNEFIGKRRETSLAASRSRSHDPQLNLMNSNSVNQGSSVSCGFWMCILATCCHHGSTCGGGICSRPKWCCNGGMGPPFWFQLTHAAHACHLAATWEVFRPSDLWSWVLLSPPQLRTNRASIWSLLGSCTDDSTFGDSVCEMPSACAGINGK